MVIGLRGKENHVPRSKNRALQGRKQGRLPRKQGILLEDEGQGDLGNER